MRDDREKKPYVEGFEELVLGAVYKLQENAYGVTIWGELEQAGRSSALGQIYATLDRLEAKGFVRSSLGEPGQERGGKRKKFFNITGSGIRALNEAERVRSFLVPAAGLRILGAELQ